MVKPSKIEYFSYIFLGLLLIGSIYILFVKIPSLNSKVDNTNNDLNNLKNSFNELNLKEVLKELSTGIFYAGADKDKDLLPSEVCNMIGTGRIGIIQQHLNIPGPPFGYSNVLNMIPKAGYISQILLSSIYTPDNTKFYVRYSKGTIVDVTNPTPQNDSWTDWIQTNSK